MTSIRLRLLKWLIGPVLLVNIAAGSLTWLLAWLPAQSAFDQTLSDGAAALAARVRATPAGPTLDLPEQARQILRSGQLDANFFVVRAGTRVLAGDADFPALPRMDAGVSAPGAFDARMRGEPVRVAATTVIADGTEVQVGYARTLRKREQTRAAILRALIPLELVATLATVGLIWFSVTNGLQPLARLRTRLNARTGDDLSPIETGSLPSELMPLAASFNDLLDRVRAGAQAQHDFLANVAHQLRTPLAGLKLQLEWLAQRHADDDKSRHSLKLMLSSAERMIRQVNQLLALARAEPSRFEKTRLEPLDLVSLIEESVQYFVEEAEKKGIDIGFDVLPTEVSGDRFLLRDLVENLVDNAIRYTPAGGAVTVGCRPDGQGGGVFTVEDTGPGIPPDKRELVFSRHVRLDDKTHGSGLGLAIVRDIARAHHASVDLRDRPGGGAVFTVHFPG